MAINGSVGNDGRPIFPIEIYGHSPRWLTSLNAVFDTGFTGFLDLPLTQCLKAGLILTSTSSYVLANGQTVNVLLCLGTVQIGKKKVVGLISINMTGSHALLGMDFIKRAKLKLEIDPVNGTVRFI